MRLTPLLQNAKAVILNHEGYIFMHIKSTAQIQEIDNYNFHALIIDNYELLHAIRAHDVSYLIPVFGSSMIDDHRSLDGMYNEHSPAINIQEIERLNVLISRYEQLPLPSHADDRIMVKLIRYLLSRGRELKAERNRESMIGYRYSILSHMSLDKLDLNHVKLLGKYVDKGWFSKTIIDNINTCPSCSNGFLHFSETCASCGSHDLSSEHLIHHFRCAYVGPESDFIKGSDMSCPKCDKEMKHIGIDYDKPSEILTCNVCAHASQESVMKATCVGCGTQSSLKQIHSFPVIDVEVSETGKAYACQTSYDDVSEMISSKNKLEGFSPYNIYKILEKHELGKVDQYKNEVYKMLISLQGELTTGLSTELNKKLMIELASIVHTYQKASDLITVNDLMEVESLLLNYSYPQLESLMDAIQYNLDKLLLDNKLTEEQGGVKIKYEKITV